ncbi:MAG: GNAT family N-acetyltransferase [Clostridia bacterium]|nr:GNAT family N-acetyltransferase [Clostridia bacterium]
MPEGIDIRIMNGREFDLSKELWLECFEEDDRAFVDLYYRTRTRPEYALGAFVYGKEGPCSMLHMIPMEMTVDKKPCRVAFVAGVCTAKEYRRSGLCTKLLTRSFSIMRESGYDHSVLQPFSFGFYSRFGYEPYASRQSVELMASDTVGTAPETVPEPSAISRIYSAYTEGFEGCARRDEARISALIEEYSLPGAVMRATESGFCAGYEEDGGEIFRADELFFLPGTDPEGILPKGYLKYVFPLPVWADIPSGAVSRTEPFNMIRPILSEPVRHKARAFSFDRY